MHASIAATLIALFLSMEKSAAQHLEALVRIDLHSWKADPAGQPVETTRSTLGRCVFGPSSAWCIEGDFARNARSSLWSTGSNIVRHSVITSESPQIREEGSPFFPAHVGQRFTTVLWPTTRWRLHGVPHVLWLALCSGEFLQAEGRRIPAPFSDVEERSGYRDETESFDDPLGLPKELRVFERESELLCYYKVTQSTNLAGFTVPLEFVLEEYRGDPGEKPRLYARASGVVVSLQRASRPEVPQEVMRYSGVAGRAVDPGR